MSWLGVWILSFTLMPGAVVSLSRVIAKRLAILSFVGGAVLLGGVSWAQEAIRTRGWSHEDFGRLVFDWTQPVGYQAELKNGALVVRFDAAIASDFSKALQRLNGYLASAEPVEGWAKCPLPPEAAGDIEEFQKWQFRRHRS